MTELHEVPVTLSIHQFHKLRRGHPVQLAASNLGKGIHKVHVNKKMATKLSKAHRENKGCRFSMAPHEFEYTVEAGGFGDFINKVKNGLSFVKHKIIDSDIYQKNLKPAVKQLVDKGIETFVPEPGRQLAHTAANKIGEVTNAFGVRGRRKPVARVAVKEKKNNRDDFIDFVAESIAQPIPGTPGFTALPQSVNGGGVSANVLHHHYYYPYVAHHKAKGGSFKLAG